MITSGEGGVVTTNNKRIFDKLKVYREHGIVRDKIKFKNKSQIETHYEQHILGYNYRMTDLHAALGNSQIKRIDYFKKKRNQIKDFYYKELKNLPIKFQEIKYLMNVHTI